MENKKYLTKESILARGIEAIGLPFENIDATHRLESGKGAIGSVIEESWFEYGINSESEPDFPEAGVELKTTPYKITSKGIRAKERLVCNIINYMEEYKYTFYTSSFWKKCNTMLLMSYEHKDNIDKAKFYIDKVALFSFPDEDLEIIKADWIAIVQKILDGKAHELSESDTLYLGACTKGASSLSVREQPFSDIMAKQRAFSLKQSYMTYILNTYIFGEKTSEKIITDSRILKDTNFEDYLFKKITPYLGKTQIDLARQFGLSTKTKNVNELILTKILGLNGKISNTAEFIKADIRIKTIRVNENNSIKESMSFPTFDFSQIAQETWEDSDFKNLLEQTKFLFVIFKFNSENALVFNNIMFWSMPEKDIQEVKKVWEKTSSIIREGVCLIKKGSRVLNNLPKASENSVCHVRPHAKDSLDTQRLPDGRYMPKQCFWLNNKYIEKQIRVK